MAILNILTYPEKSLLEPSEKVENIDEEIKKLVEDMGETMFDAPGIGLAAPQVGVNKRIIVYDVHAGDTEPCGTESSNSNDDGIDDAGREEDMPEPKKEFKALINPEIIDASGSIISKDEGCLSVLDYTADVKRYERVIVRALDIDGKEIEFEKTGIPAVIMQHEIDHLDGILYIDRISSLKRAMYKKKIAKKLKES